ncbi:acetyltransferase [Spirochaetia bacterium]|nr:acetyltransferase [Spirochaetia bacterium]
MIINTINLSNKQIVEINNLVALCEKHDNAKMCIQMDHSLNNAKDLKSWVVSYTNNELIGVLSIFAPRVDEAEISVCVHPEHRRKGTAGELLETAHENLNGFNINTVLYVCDRNSKDGTAALNSRELKIHHTEYTMKYIRQMRHTGAQRITVKMAGENDIETMAGILVDAFGGSPDEAKKFIESSIQSETRKGYIGIKDNKGIGIAFVGYDKDISINTLGILREEQQKGYGKELLNSIINQLDYGNKDIVIDVDSTNIHAYTLYKNNGFKETVIIDYYQHRKSKNGIQA